MKRKYICLLLLVAIVLNLLILNRLHKQTKSFEAYKIQIDNILDYRDIRLKYNVRFDNSPIKIDEINELELCYIVSKLHCNQCVDSIVNLIQDFKSANDDFHFRILAKYDSEQDLHLFKRLHGIDSSIIPGSALDFPIMETEIPLFFIYDPKDRSAHHVFTPDPHDSDMTMEYLQLVNDLLLDSAY